MSVSDSPAELTHPQARVGVAAAGARRVRSERRPPRLVLGSESEKLAQDAPSESPQNVALEDRSRDLNESPRGLPMDPSGLRERRARKPEHVRDLLGAESGRWMSLGSERGGEYGDVDAETYRVFDPDESRRSGQVRASETHLLLELAQGGVRQ